MAVVSSKMLALGTPAPAFDLPDTVSGGRVSLAGLADGPALVVIFMCNHCPYVVHIQDGLAAFSRDYRGSGAAIVGISANDAENYPDDSPEQLGEVARRRGYGFPVLYDETQETAKAYTAVCTPDFFLFGKDRTLAYRGRFDSSRPNSGKPVTGEDLRAALDAVLDGRPAPEPQHPSMGCSIKWKPGNEPA